MALETGMRHGEVMGLAWERIDFGRNVIRLEITKSGRRREIPMRRAVYDVLAPLRAEALTTLKPGPDGKLPELRGRVWPGGSIRTAFESAIEEAKIDNFSFHDLRHHFASWFVMRGGSLQALQKILGHQDIKLTLRYAHLSPEHLRGEMEKTSVRQQQKRSEAVELQPEVEARPEAVRA